MLLARPDSVNGDGSFSVQRQLSTKTLAGAVISLYQYDHLQFVFGVTECARCWGEYVVFVGNG